MKPRTPFVYPAILAVLILGGGALSTPVVHAADCANAYASGSAAPTGYGASWNLFTTAKELLVQGSNCSATGFTLTVGSGGSQLVYKQGYKWSGTAWSPFTLTGGALQGDAWFTDTAKLDFTQTAAQNGVFVVGYVCQQINSAWKCGCSETSCATAMWQLQKVTITSATGGTGTALHYTPLIPWSQSDMQATVALGFNLVHVETPEQLNAIPTGTKGLVWRPFCAGVTSDFTSTMQSFAGNPKLWGFYLYDEPTPGNCFAANLTAESNWIHANIPGAKTFVVLLEPDHVNVADYSAGIDYIGLDPYPCGSGTCDLSFIQYDVDWFARSGVPKEKQIPVFEAFGGGDGYTMPTAAQSQGELDAWATALPNPAFDYAYTWHWGGGTGIKETPYLQTIFKAHNTGQ